MVFGKDWIPETGNKGSGEQSPDTSDSRNGFQTLKETSLQKVTNLN
jgi:hypothetical protein